MFQCVCYIVLNQLNCFISVFLLLVVLMSFIHSGLSEGETRDSETSEGETGDSETSEATV